MHGQPSDHAMHITRQFEVVCWCVGTKHALQASPAGTLSTPSQPHWASIYSPVGGLALVHNERGGNSSTRNTIKQPFSTARPSEHTVWATFCLCTLLIAYPCYQRSESAFTSTCNY